MKLKKLFTTPCAIIEINKISCKKMIKKKIITPKATGSRFALYLASNRMISIDDAKCITSFHCFFNYY